MVGCLVVCLAGAASAALLAFFGFGTWHDAFVCHSVAHTSALHFVVLQTARRFSTPTDSRHNDFERAKTEGQTTGWTGRCSVASRCCAWCGCDEKDRKVLRTSGVAGLAGEFDVARTLHVR